jgi:hypothetical protein
MKKEDYLESDDIEIATLYANIIYQEKGLINLQKLLHDKNKYIVNVEKLNITGKVKLVVIWQNIVSKIIIDQTEKQLKYTTKEFNDLILKTIIKNGI